MSQIIFVSGVDTSSGKTVLTALLLEHLRNTGREVLGVKPFCSGSRRDLEILAGMGGGQAEPKDLNLVYFSQPLAPWVAGRRKGAVYTLDQVVGWLKERARQVDYLVVEGSGGILAPLGEGFDALGLVDALGCEVAIAGRNRLGIINHMLLTINVLRGPIRARIRPVLLGVRRPALSARTNAEIIQELSGLAVVQIPFLGPKLSISGLKQAAKKLKKNLAKLTD